MLRILQIKGISLENERELSGLTHSNLRGHQSQSGVRWRQEAAPALLQVDRPNPGAGFLPASWR